MDGVKILFFFVFTKLNCRRLKVKTQLYTGCPTTYQTRHFFNNSKTNEDNATRFEQEYVRCVRNEEECVCSVCLFRCNIFIGFRIIKEMPGLVGSGTPYIYIYVYIYQTMETPNKYMFRPLTGHHHVVHPMKRVGGCTMYNVPSI